MLLIAGFCVPLMLFVKPFWVLANEKAAAKEQNQDFNQIDQVEMVNINSSEVNSPDDTFRKALSESD